MKKIIYPPLISGVVGPLQIIVDTPGLPEGAIGIAVIAHPHPQMGGTMHNKVVHTLAKILAQKNYVAIRFNYRGVEQSAGDYDAGRGEVDDYLAVLNWASDFFQLTRLFAAGFSFGSYIAANAVGNLPSRVTLNGVWLVAPPILKMPFSQLPPFSAPTFVIQGTEDDVVDPIDTYAWCDARVDQVKLLKMENAGHFFHQRLAELRQLLLPTLL